MKTSGELLKVSEGDKLDVGQFHGTVTSVNSRGIEVEVDGKSRELSIGQALAGEKAAREASRCLVESGYVVASGLAAGIDTAVHEAALEAGGPDLIASANIGCLTHLESGTRLPVVHWIELLDQRLAPAS